jgi:hypothetical protein
MDVRADLTAACATSDLLPWVEDLSRYPSWMRLAHRVEPVPPDPLGPAWSVELRAQVGPLARSKRLRMVRVTHDDDNAATAARRDGAHAIVFERHESDGRRHSPWVLTVSIAPGDDATTSHLAMHLHYGGKLWTGGVLERILSEEIERGRDRLVELVSSDRSS